MGKHAGWCWSAAAALLWTTASTAPTTTVTSVTTVITTTSTAVDGVRASRRWHTSESITAATGRGGTPLLDVRGEHPATLPQPVAPASPQDPPRGVSGAPVPPVYLVQPTGTEIHTLIPPNPTLIELTRACQHHLSPEDHAMFEQATGNTVASILTHPVWHTAEGQLEGVFSNQKMLLHPLNAIGLHALRALLHERIHIYARERRGSTSHPLYERYARDGYLAIPVNDSKLLYLMAGGRSETEHRVPWIQRVLHMVSGYKKIKWAGFSRFKRYVHTAADHQFYMHVDTVIPTWKMWVFPKTDLSKGPFHYVRGSHRSSVGRLRWLFDRSRGLVNRSALEALPKRRRSLMHGPYYDRTHGFDGSTRFESFDPVVGGESAAPLLASYGFGMPEPVTTEGRGTLLIADASGLHYRGYAPPGTVRISARWGDSGGGCDGCIPRKNPFFCEPLPDEC